MASAPPVTEAFLDGVQYSASSIRAYEAVYGRDFVSPGGADMARELLLRLALGSGSRVLDAGCGPGGSAFLMAREHGWRAHGIDLSRNMIAIAQARCRDYGLTETVTFEHGDILALQRRNPYHAIYSRDVFLHIHDKPRLLRVLFDALRPGGRLLFTDYCCGEPPWRVDFAEYVASRGYCLHTVPQYIALVKGAGFTDVTGRDLTARFEDILAAELAKIDAADIDAEARAKLGSGWRAKLRRVESGDQRWGLLEATRP